MAGAKKKSGSTPVNWRIPDDVLERLDEYVAQLEETQGLKVSRTEAALSAMRKGLEALLAPKKRRG